MAKHRFYGIEKSTTGHVEIARQLKKAYGVGSFLKNRDLAYMIHYFNHFRGENLGIERVKIIRHPLTGIGKAFEVYRYGEDFGEFMSMTPKKPPREKNVKSAFREAIHHLTHEFKEQAYKNTQFIVCPIEEIDVPKVASHVDHYEMEFDPMLLQFLESQAMTLDEVGIKKAKVGIGYQLSDPAFKKHFIEYHNRHTNLRIVSKWANLSTLKKKKS